MAENYIPKIVYGTGDTTIEFDYPPEGLDSQSDKIVTKAKVSQSTNGKIYASFNFNEEQIALKFSFITQELKDAVKTFITTHASRFNEFKYYPHKSETTYYTYTLAVNHFTTKFKPMARKEQDNGDFLYEFVLKMRRTI